MQSEFTVVSDIGEIGRLNAKLTSQLKRTFRHVESRELSYPAGHDTANVFFEEKTGVATRGWAPVVRPNKLVNFLLYGEPNTTKWLEITVQLNFPAGTYNRRMAGVFVKDSNGDPFIAHNGKLTKGRAGLHKAEVLREFAPSVVEAQDGKLTTKVILIAELAAPDLTDRLFSFATEAREVATQLGAANSQVPEDNQKAHSQILQLRDYFDEYAGQGKTKGHPGGTRVVEHGDVVRELEAYVRESGKTQKAQAIDLAVVAKKFVDLFEVKTSARTTDIYTGIGQLFIHGECIADLLKLPVRRHLVLPEKPNQDYVKHISGKGDINIVTFTKVNGSFKFSGLKVPLP
jgi:hypothetical protein